MGMILASFVLAKTHAPLVDHIAIYTGLPYPARSPGFIAELLLLFQLLLLVYQVPLILCSQLSQSHHCFNEQPPGLPLLPIGIIKLKLPEPTPVSFSSARELTSRLLPVDTRQSVFLGETPTKIRPQVGGAGYHNSMWGRWPVPSF